MACEKPAELADGPIVCVRWQGEGIRCVLSANQLSLLFYTRLALNLHLTGALKFPLV